MPQANRDDRPHPLTKRPRTEPETNAIKPYRKDSTNFTTTHTTAKKPLARPPLFKVGELAWIKTFIESKNMPTDIPVFDPVTKVVKRLDTHPIQNLVTNWPVVIRSVIPIGGAQSVVKEVVTAPLLMELKNGKMSATSAQVYKDFDLVQRAQHVYGVQLVGGDGITLYIMEKDCTIFVAWRPVDEWWRCEFVGGVVPDRTLAVFVGALRRVMGFSDGCLAVFGGKRYVDVDKVGRVESWEGLQFGGERIHLGDVVRAEEGTARPKTFGAYEVFAICWGASDPHIKIYGIRLGAVKSDETTDFTYFEFNEREGKK
ncbi:hypothetical protein HK097_006894, partial [Rhizophlyctis rosea]